MKFNLNSSPKKIILLVIIFAILILFVLFFTGTIWFTSPNRNDYPIRGIDVSHHQGEINWTKVAEDDVTFAYIKATEADDLKDKLFNQNWDNAQRVGIAVGAYHFYSLAYPGKIQAENFISTVPTTTKQLPPVIDLEYVGNSKKRPLKIELQNNLHEFVNIVSKQYRTDPIIYTTYEFYEDYLYPEFSNNKIWIRDIYSKPNTNKIGSWEIWQYSPRGKVDGIKGFVDLNVFSQKSLSQI